MDLKGQVRADRVMTIILLVFSAGGFLLGWLGGHFGHAAAAVALGTAAAAAAVVPDWPAFNRDAPRWLPDAAAAHARRRPPRRSPLWAAVGLAPSSSSGPSPSSAAGGGGGGGSAPGKSKGKNRRH